LKLIVDRAAKRAVFGHQLEPIGVVRRECPLRITKVDNEPSVTSTFLGLSFG
jgi:hypothetical protein